MFDNVVVGVEDYAAGHRVLELAEMLVSRRGRITLVYVEVVQTKLAPQLDAKSVEERQRFGLEHLRRVRDSEHVTADVARVQARSVRRGLYDFASSRAADLIVIGASSRNKVARSQLGDDVREMLQDPPLPLAVAPNGYSGGSARMGKIGVAYGGSQSSKLALGLARRIADEHHATLVAYEAVASPIPTRAEDELDAIRHFGASVDLLVLGSRSAHPPDHVFRRSPSQRIAAEPPSPLLVIPASPDRASGADADVTRIAQ